MKQVVRTLVAGLAFVAFSTAGNAQTYSVEGASPTSLTGIVAQSLALYADKENISLQAVLSQTLTKSILKVAAGQIDLAVAPPLAYRAMTRGVGPYKDMSEDAIELSQNVRSLFGFPGGTFHAITWADSGITEFSDLRDKRVFIGPPAGAANAMITNMVQLAGGGLVVDEDYDPVRAPWGAGQQSFQDGQFDVFITAVAVGSQSVNELSLQREIRILNVGEEAIAAPEWAATMKKLALNTVTIPAGTYAGQVNGDQDLTTVSTVMMMAAHKDLPEDVAYRLTRAYWENLPEMKASNALMRVIDETDFFTGIAAPLHPGALRYYQERSADIPAELIAE